MIKNLYNEAVFGLCKGVLLLVSKRRRASFQHRLTQWLPLDYSKKEIKLKVASRWEYQRLDACRKEPETVEWIEKNLKKGESFYDVGANVGGYSMIAAAVLGNEGKVYSFEPGAGSFATLCQNAAKNGFSCITAFNMCLSNERAICNIELNFDEPGTTTAMVDSRSSTMSQGVLADRLDDFIATYGLTPPNHIKIDVDGAEMLVIGGMPETLKNPNLKTILIELDQEREDAAKILEIIQNAGFEVESKHGRVVKTCANYILRRKA